MKTMPNPENIKDSILDAVDRLLARHGYKKMTIEDLARAVGIGKGTIYLYFPSKQEIVLSYVDRIFNRLLESLWKIARSEAPFSDRIKLMMISRVQMFYDFRRHYAESLTETLHLFRSSLVKKYRVYLQAEAEIFAAVLRDGQRAGTVGIHDLNSAARVLALSTSALLPFNFSTREIGKRNDVIEETIIIADFLLLGGLRAEKTK
jgi:AcrR family transcriptional regulator